MNEARTMMPNRALCVALVMAATVLSAAGCKDRASAPAAEAEHAPPGAAKATALAEPRVAQADDWCRGHALPESMCSKCNPGLAKKFQQSGDWCSEHGFPESVCPTCNPMQPPAEGAAGAAAGCSGGPDDWCEGHGVPESLCSRCNPSLIPAFKATGDWCEEHGLPESQCLKCNPDLKIERPTPKPEQE